MSEEGSYGTTQTARAMAWTTARLGQGRRALQSPSSQSLCVFFLQKPWSGAVHGRVPLRAQEPGRPPIHDRRESIRCYRERSQLRINREEVHVRRGRVHCFKDLVVIYYSYCPKKYAIYSKQQKNNDPELLHVKGPRMTA